MKSLAIVVLFVSLLPADTGMEIKKLGHLFGKYEGTIVVHDAASGTYYVHNPKRSEKRFTPFSTFKIANSIVALETGVIKDTDTEFSWDSAKYPNADWWPEQWLGRHTMRTAIKFSVVPFYREIAAHVGKSRMQAYVDMFDYGNKDLSSGTDDFWLNGSLSISAKEQIGFLKDFYDNRPGVASETIDAVKRILIQEENPQFRLSAKTGAGTGFDAGHPERALGWYVGYVEKGKDVFYFAMNIEGDSFDEILAPRVEITKAVLKELKIID